MENVSRGSDGRRLFTAEFKRQQIDRVLRGELTAAELSRELGMRAPAEFRREMDTLVDTGCLTK